MTLRELIDTICQKSKKSQRAIATTLGISPQLLSTKIVSESMLLSEAILACDSYGLELTPYDAERHEAIDFDRSEIAESDIKYSQAVQLLRSIGADFALIDVSTGMPIPASYQGYGRRVRQKIGGETYDTMQARAISSGLKITVGKYGSEGKYKTDDPRELYQRADGKYFIAIYGERLSADAIVPCTPDEAREFVSTHGMISEMAK